MELRQYQQDLIDDLRRRIHSGKKRLCAVLGCGGGKSVIQGTIARLTTENNCRVLFMVHRRELCQQIENTFNQCCVDMELCHIGMVQTMCRHVEDITPPDLILVDECHHILSRSYRKIIDSFPDAVVLGFTATPVRMNEGGLGAVFEELVESVSTEWLIEHNYLAPYTYYSVPLADTRGLHVRAGEFVAAEVEELMNRSAIFGSAVDNWKIRAEGKQTIVYCSSISTSRQTAEAFQAAGIAAAHLDGTTPEREREETVQAFRNGKVKVLCNVDLFGEGFDVPDCEAVIMLRPTQSLSLHIQQSMRPMRYKEGKKAIILDHVGNHARHGLPDEPREWTLEERKRKRKNERPMRQCPNCFAVYPTTMEECPICHVVLQRDEQREQEVVENVILQEVAKQRYDAYKECTTFADLDRFRKAKKFKVGWVIHKAIEMGIPLPRNYQYMARRFYGY